MEGCEVREGRKKKEREKGGRKEEINVNLMARVHDDVIFIAEVGRNDVIMRSCFVVMVCTTAAGTYGY